MNNHQLGRNEPIDSGVKRIATNLGRRIISDFSRADIDRKVAIHEARKGCKLLRGYLRLVKLALTDDFDSIDASVRDASARLSGLRDLEVMTEKLVELKKSECKSITGEELAKIRSILSVQYENAVETRQNAVDPVASFVADMQAIVARIDSWRFRRGFSKAVRTGFEKTYRHGLKAMRAARRLPSDAILHAWRKWVKYHEHQLGLLSKKWKGKAAKRLVRLAQLSETLGDDHDLAVIQTKLGASEVTKNRPQLASLEQLLRAIAMRRTRLQAKAFKLGKKLYRRHPKSLVKRLRRLY